MRLAHRPLYCRPSERNFGVLKQRPQQLLLLVLLLCCRWHVGCSRSLQQQQQQPTITQHSRSGEVQLSNRTRPRTSTGSFRGIRSSVGALACASALWAGTKVRRLYGRPAWLGCTPGTKLRVMCGATQPYMSSACHTGVPSPGGRLLRSERCGDAQQGASHSGKYCTSEVSRARYGVISAVTHVLPPQNRRSCEEPSAMPASADRQVHPRVSTEQLFSSQAPH